MCSHVSTSVLGHFFVFNDQSTTEIYTDGHTLSLHDALPIYGDHPARVQQVEQMASLDRLVIGRQRQFRGQQFLALFLRLAELVEQEIGARMLDRKSTRLNSSH